MPGWRIVSGLLLMVLASLAGATDASAQPAAEFFRSHSVTLYIGYGPGGGYDLACRLFAAYLGRHLPGNPDVIARNQPGAGSLRLANELYNVLPGDGTALGMIGEVLVIDQVLGDPQARFQSERFDWIGRIIESDPVLAIRPDAAVATIEDARTKEAVIGVPGAGSATMLTLTVLNNLMGTKFKLVSGYDGSAQIRLAVERGEVQGTGSSPWRLEKDWIRQQRLRVIYQASLDPDPDLPGVPTVAELGRNEDERRVLTFFSSYTIIGRSILAPPGVPADRLAMLRAAFDATVADPAFVGEARKANLDLAVLSGDKLQARVAEAVALSGPLLERPRQAARAAMAER
jgi:tripartite-type tricarboxylate transporter receptor subunit TctC